MALAGPVRVVILSPSPAAHWDPRRGVLWVGPTFDQNLELLFKNRRFEVVSVDLSTYAKQLPFGRAVVFRFDHANPALFKATLLQVGTRAAQNGLSIYYDEVDEVGGAYFANEIKPALPPELSIRRLAKELDLSEQLLEAIEKTEPGPACNPQLNIKHDLEINFGSEERSLLERAFSDCSNIFVRNLAGGRSGADVLQIYATFNDAPQSRPLPFFAKIEETSEIQKEITNYNNFAAHYIPFNLRPNLDHARCLSGIRKAILVGNFVEGAEPLSKITNRGSALHAIHSLFENTLKGWRYPELAFGVPKGNIAIDLQTFVREPARFQHDKPEGATHTSGELVEMMRQMPAEKYLRGRIHGDLNAGNVLMRTSDTVVIDLAKATIGPLIADPAALEVSIAFGIA
jgi:hypothetical protein